VLDIHVPETLSLGAIPAFLREVEHDLLIYAASFWLVGIYWLFHHFIMAHVRHVDHRLLLQNLLFLFAATLLPFLTKLKNAYPEEALAAQLFGIGHLACGLSLVGLWRYVCAHAELCSEPVPPRVQRRLTQAIGTGCLIAAVASSMGHVDARLCAYLLATVPLAYGYMLRRATRTTAG